MHALRLRLLTVVIAVTAAGCSESPAAPRTGEASPSGPDPVMAAVLGDSWLASFLDVEDAHLQAELDAQLRRAAPFLAVVRERLAEPERLSPGDALALSVLDLAISAASGNPLSPESEP